MWTFFIQNAEDNDYLAKVDPSLEFVITFEDITNYGALATLLIFNNEKVSHRKTLTLFAVLVGPPRKVIGNMVTLEKKILYLVF